MVNSDRERKFYFDKEYKVSEMENQGFGMGDGPKSGSNKLGEA